MTTQQSDRTVSTSFAVRFFFFAFIASAVAVIVHAIYAFTNEWEPTLVNVHLAATVVLGMAAWRAEANARQLAVEAERRRKVERLTVELQELDQLEQLYDRS